MKISVYGLGYVGSVGLACLAQEGHEVLGVDTNEDKVNAINNGISPIVEAQVNDMIAKNKALGRIKATHDGKLAARQTEVSFICVGTPSKNNGHLDFSAIFQVAEEIARGIKDKSTFHVIVIRSTVLPGTNAKTVKIIEKFSQKKAHLDFAVVSNPEFLREGTAVYDYYTPPYTLVGSNNPKAVGIMREIYKTIEAPFVVADIKIAELMKLVNNSFHAYKIVFANEIGNICKSLNVDSHQLMEIFCMDKKLNLSDYYLKPGFAYGGSCLPKDLKALITIAHDQYLSSPVLENIDRSNELQKQQVFEYLLGLGKRRIGFLGISFKEGTDDLRYSPIIDIIERLIGKGFQVSIYDRNVQLAQLIGTNKEYILNKIPLISTLITNDPAKLVRDSEVIIITNKENEFTTIANQIPKDKIIYDLVNLDFPSRAKHKNYVGVAW